MGNCSLYIVHSLYVMASTLTPLTLGAIYDAYTTSNITACSSVTINDHCILHCDISNNNSYIFNCGHAGYCTFLCEEYKCAEYAVINAQNTGSLSVISSANNCLEYATINLPNYGNAYISPTQPNSMQGTTIMSGTNTGDIIIDCSFGVQCRDITINAESATFLKIIVGASSEFGGDKTLHDLSVINCPLNSDYDGAEIAPCIIDLSKGGLLSYVEIDTLNGLPQDLWITTGNISLSKVYIKCYNRAWSLNNGESLRSEVCWTETTNVLQTTTTSSAHPDLLHFLNNTEIKNFMIMLVLGLLIGCCFCCGCGVILFQSQQFKHNKEMNNVIHNFMSSMNNMLFTMENRSNPLFKFKMGDNDEYIVADNDGMELEMEEKRTEEKDKMIGGEMEKYNQLISPKSEFSSTFQYDERDDYNNIEDIKVSEESHSVDDIENETNIDVMDTQSALWRIVNHRDSDDDDDDKKESNLMPNLIPKHEANKHSVDIMDVLDEIEINKMKRDYGYSTEIGNVVEIKDIIRIKSGMLSDPDEFVIDDDDDEDTLITKGWNETEQKATETNISHFKTDTAITMLDGKPTRRDEYSDYEAHDNDHELSEKDQESEEYQHEAFEEFEEFQLDDYEGKRQNQRNTVLSEGPRNEFNI